MNELSIKKMANQTWIGGIILVGLTYGGFATISNYILPYSERTGASIAQISVSFTIIAIATTIFSLFMGNIIKRMKAKTIITISAVMLSLIHFALAFSNSLIVLYIAAFLFGTAVAFTGFGFMQTVIMWWFEPNKIASKISFLTIGLAVFSFIESPVIAQSIISNGLKMTAAIHGVVDLVGVVVVGIVLIKENPKHYGFNLAHNESANTAGDEAAKIKVVPLSAVLKTYPFWCLFLVTVFLNLTFMGYSNNASPFYQSFGLDPLQAAFCISIVSVCQVGTAPLFGYLVDKLKLTKPTVFFAIILAVTFFCSRFINGYTTAIIFAVFASFFAFAGSVGPIGYRVMYPDSDPATLVGISNAASQLGNAIGGVIAGSILTATGSYTSYMVVAAGLLLICAILIVIATSQTAQNCIAKLSSKS